MTMRGQRYLDVLAHSHGRECRCDLEGAPHAQPPDLARLEASGVLPQHMNPAGVGRGLAVEHVEAGRLAGAIGPDQRKDFARLKRKRDATHGMDPAIGLTQSLDRQKWLSAHSAVSICEARRAALAEDGRRWRIDSITPTMPFGKATTITTIKPPSTSFDHSVWLTSQIESAL